MRSRRACLSRRARARRSGSASAGRALASCCVAARGRAAASARYLAVGHNRVVPAEGIDPTVHVVVHKIEMSMVAVLIRVSGVRAPLLISVIGAKIGYHDGDGRVLDSTRSRVNAIASRSKLVASATARTAPRGSVGVIEELASCGGVRRPLPTEGIGVTSAATARAHLSVPITRSSCTRQTIEHGRISGTSRVGRRSQR